MKVPCTYTLNELQRITPNLRKEHFFSECPKVKKALHILFWNLGCTLPDKPDIVEGVVTRNRFGCIDDSIRINCWERQDNDKFVISNGSSPFNDLLRIDQSGNLEITNFLGTTTSN